MNRKQRTIGGETKVRGVGLHTGGEALVSLRPAGPNTGVFFNVKNNGSAPVGVALRPENTCARHHRTILEDKGVEVHTIEHLLAALAGNWVDNVYIDVEGKEIPGGDGSAKVFSDLINETGIVEQDASVHPFVLREPITVSDGNGGVISAVPHKSGLKLSYVVDYPQTKLAQGLCEFEVAPETFNENIAGCRTFCLEEHAEAMKAQGCGKGANTDNTLVLKFDSVVNNKLRFEDECARHKVLDLLGDISIIGRSLCMHIVALRSGHELNEKFVKKLKQVIFRQENPAGLMNVREIQETLPHRYPFLLVDRILEMNLEEKYVIGLKNVSANEEFFCGHFPGQPVMPGVLQVEALAQTAGVLLLKSDEVPEGDLLAVLMSVTDVKYRKPVVPGDQLLMRADIEKIRGRIGQVWATASVDGEVVTEARIKFSLVDKNEYI